MTRNEPPLITMAREIQMLGPRAFRTVRVPKPSYSVWKDLHVRPQILSETDNERVYQLTSAQARKIMDRWEHTGLKYEWEQYLARQS